MRRGERRSNRRRCTIRVESIKGDDERRYTRFLSHTEIFCMASFRVACDTCIKSCPPIMTLSAYVRILVSNSTISNLATPLGGEAGHDRQCISYLGRRPFGNPKVEVTPYTNHHCVFPCQHESSISFDCGNTRPPPPLPPKKIQSMALVPVRICYPVGPQVFSLIHSLNRLGQCSFVPVDFVFDAFGVR